MTKRRKSFGISVTDFGSAQQPLGRKTPKILKYQAIGELPPDYTETRTWAVRSQPFRNLAGMDQTDLALLKRLVEVAEVVSERRGDSARTLALSRGRREPATLPTLPAARISRLSSGRAGDRAADAESPIQCRCPIESSVVSTSDRDACRTHSISARSRISLRLPRPQVSSNRTRKTSLIPIFWRVAPRWCTSACSIAARAFPRAGSGRSASTCAALMACNFFRTLIAARPVPQRCRA